MNNADPQALSSLLAARELRECVGCGAKFIGLSWHRHCHACYRYIKTLPDLPRRDLDAELRLAKAEVEMLRSELSRERQATLNAAERLASLESSCTRLTAERDTWMKRYYQAQPADPAAKQLTIPLPIMRRLLWLCHPDRHGNSEAATIATAWLLAQRSR